MSQPSASSQLAAIEHRDYALSSDLAKLCLPEAFQDKSRKLAHVDSICIAFLIIGLAGVKQQQVNERPLTLPADTMPVIYTPPEKPKEQPETPPDQPQEPQEATVETPQVVTVVSPSAAGVAFAVPVEGPVVVAKSPRFATPPPLSTPRQPHVFIPGDAKGTFPWPTQRDLPPEFSRRAIEAKLMVRVVVDPSGAPAKVEIKDSSGDVTLDRFAVQWIKRHWRWLSGEISEWDVPWEFAIK